MISFLVLRSACCVLLVLATSGAIAQRPNGSSSPSFSCSPSVVGPNDVLVIRKSSTLIEMMVTKPKSKISHLLVMESPEPGMQLLMSTEAFGRAKEVRIPVGELTGFRWIVNGEQEKIFSAPGNYRFTASDNLGSDASDLLSCQVQYRPTK